MSLKTWIKVDEYFSRHLSKENEALESALRKSDKAGLPEIAVSASQGQFLNMMTKLTKAQRILEVGTLGGYSTIWMAQALPENGRIITLEFDAHHANVARENFIDSGLESVIELRTGDATKLMDDMIDQNEAPFDLVFIDADKANTPNYFERSLKLSRPGTLIIFDNVVRKGEVINPDTQDEDVRGIQTFVQMAVANKKISASTLQTVGAKGYDGLAFILVEQDP